MIDFDKLAQCGQDLTRTFALLDRAGEISIISTPQVLTKRGLLDEARLALEAAKAALSH